MVTVSQQMYIYQHIYSVLIVVKNILAKWKININLNYVVCKPFFILHGSYLFPYPCHLKGGGRIQRQPGEYISRQIKNQTYSHIYRPTNVQEIEKISINILQRVSEETNLLISQAQRDHKNNLKNDKILKKEKDCFGNNQFIQQLILIKNLVFKVFQHDVTVPYIRI